MKAEVKGSERQYTCNIVYSKVCIFLVYIPILQRRMLPMSLNNSAGTASIKTSQHTLTTLVYQLIVHMYHIP